MENPGHTASSWRREGEGVRPGGCRAPRDSRGLPRVTKTRSLHFHSQTPCVPVPTSAWTSGKGRPERHPPPGLSDTSPGVSRRECS